MFSIKTAENQRTITRYMKRGEQRLYLHRGLEADGAHETTTPSDIGLKDEMGRLEGVSGGLPRERGITAEWISSFSSFKSSRSATCRIWTGSIA